MTHTTTLPNVPPNLLITRQHAVAIDAVHQMNRILDYYGIESPSNWPARDRYRFCHSLTRCARREAMARADDEMGDPHP